MMNVTGFTMSAPVSGALVNGSSASGKANSGFFQALSQAMTGGQQVVVDGALVDGKLSDAMNGDISLLLANLSSEELAELISFVGELIGRQQNGDDLQLFTEEELADIDEKFASMEQFLQFIMQMSLHQQTQNQSTDDMTILTGKSYASTHGNQGEKFVVRGDVLKEQSLVEQVPAQIKTEVQVSQTAAKNQLVEVIKALLTASEKQEFAQNGLTTKNEPSVHLASLQNQHQSVLGKEIAQISAASEVDVEASSLAIEKVSGQTEGQGAFMGNNGEQKHSETPTERVTSASIQESAGKLNTQAIFADTIHSAEKSANPSEMKMTYTSPGQFQKQIEELVVNQAKMVSKPNGQHTMRITLHPENLGSLQVTVVAKEGQVTASIVTDTMATKELLDNTINNLRVAMVQTGIQIDRIEVQQHQSLSNLTQPTAGAQGYMHHQRKEQEQQEQQQGKKNKQTGKFSLEELEELAMDFIHENQLDRRFVHQDDLATTVNYTV